MDTRPNFKADISPAERDEWDAAIEHHGLGQSKAVGRMIRWFIQQDEVTQKHVLATLPSSLSPGTARAIIDRVVDELITAFPREAFAKGFDGIIQHLADPPVPPHAGPKVDQLVKETET